MAAIIVLVMNIKAVQKNPYISIRFLCTLLFILSGFRYITLLLFAKAPSLELMSKMENFYFITIIGLTIPMILVLWYITPLYRDKVNPLVLGLICMPHIIFYMAIIILKPFQIVKSDTIGYCLRQPGNWAMYLALIQAIFIVGYILFAVYGFKICRYKQTRGQYLVLIMCQLLFFLDGLTYFGFGTPSIPTFTLTEVFGFLGVYYGFSRPLI